MLAHRGFVRAGAALDGAADGADWKEIKNRSPCGTQFTQKPVWPMNGR